MRPSWGWGLLGAPKKSGALGCSLVSLLVNPALTTGHGNRDVTVTFQVMHEFYIDKFIILEFLGLEYGKIDTKIESVAFLSPEIWDS